ncbi:RNA-guided endonuclease TnpB family protein [Clostridium sp. MT-14]|uniref:RNA-guided endonuclease TnpB family protein n=1 Tax=Clostridium sp. MT-14 TaxID=3348360 RepID=UPI0035F34304
MSKSKTSSYIVTLQLHTQLYQEYILNKRFNIARQIYNCCLNELYKRYNLMRESKQYQYICKLPKSTNRNKLFKDLNVKFGITEYSLHDYIKPMQKYFKKNIDSFTAQKIATRAYNTFQKLLFHKAKKVKFKKYGGLNSVEGKSNRTGIMYRDGYIIWNGLRIPIIIKKNDIYAQKAIQDRIKFCRIKREIIKGKYHYYAQLVLEGIPPKKINNETGEIIGGIGQGNVGIDIGTQTIAYSSQYDVGLKELSPETNGIDKQLRLLQRKMDRSKRVMNPNKYNTNGTINTKNKDKWIFSNHYIKIRNIRKELYRKQREIRKQSHYKLINYLLSLGDTFYVEDMNYKGLQSKSKKAIKNKNGKFNKKKRFGKSLGNKAPSMFLTILNQKLRYNNNELNKINTVKVKASQYNHMTGEYKKKKLSERWNYFNIDGEEIKIQRDLYSSFLIMNVKDNLKEIDQDKCFKTFNNFKKMHDIVINELGYIKNKDNKRIISSMGI